MNHPARHLDEFSGQYRYWMLADIYLDLIEAEKSDSCECPLSVEEIFQRWLGSRFIDRLERYKGALKRDELH